MMFMRTRTFLILAMLSLGLGVASESLADHRSEALALAEEARMEAQVWHLDEAAIKLRDAIELWEHPKFLANLAEVLSKMGQQLGSSEQERTKLEVYDLVTRALEVENAARRNGAAYLSEVGYSVVMQRQRELSKTVARVAVSCTQSGVWIKLDGQRVFDCPGRTQITVLPGKEFTLEAHGADPKTGREYAPEARTFSLYRTQEARWEVKLWFKDELFVYRRRTDSWKPWAFAASGAVALTVGLLVYRDSQQGFELFDTDFRTLCPTGCLETDPESPAPRLRGIRWERTLGQAVGILGTLGFAAGLAGLYYNRPLQHQRYNPQDSENNNPVRVHPLASASYVGVAASKRF